MWPVRPQQALGEQSCPALHIHAYTHSGTKASGPRFAIKYQEVAKANLRTASCSCGSPGPRCVSCMAPVEFRAMQLKDHEWSAAVRVLTQ
jgi:hypothetical protein